MASDGQSGVTPLGPEEYVAKCAIYPRFLSADTGIFAVEALIELGRISGGSKPILAISCASRSLLKAYADVHQYGCKLATFMNEKRAEKLSRKLSRPNETVHYRGFYDIFVREVLAISSDAYSIAILPKPEFGFDEHCNIVLQPDVNKTKTQLGDARADVIIRISAMLRGPAEHMCDYDADISSFLTQSELPKLCSAPMMPAS